MNKQEKTKQHEKTKQQEKTKSKKSKKSKMSKQPLVFVFQHLIEDHLFLS